MQSLGTCTPTHVSNRMHPSLSQESELYLLTAMDVGSDSFPKKLDPVFLERVNVTKRKTIIFECEFLAILFSFFMWKDLLKLCNVVTYADNDAVRDCLISCNTSSVNAAPILDACLELELQLAWNPWFSRVPTESNVADDPSRLETKQLIEQGCLRDHCDYEQMWLRLVHTSGEGSTQH